MSDIDIISYVKEVEANRQILLHHCKQNSQKINDNCSLRTAVNTAITIKDTTKELPKQADLVYVDIDGTELEKTVVDVGTPFVQSEIVPNYDPDYLEFDRWVRTKGIKDIEGVPTVQNTVLFGALYRNKHLINVEGTIVRPTIFKIFITNTAKTLTMSFKAPNHTTSNPTHYTLNWGDNTENTTGISTSTAIINISHTYTKPGVYAIMFAANNVYNGLICDNNAKKNVLEVYYGDKSQLSYDNLKQLTALRAVNIAEGIDLINSTSGLEGNYTHCLRTVIWPDIPAVSKITSIGYGWDNAIRYLIVSENNTQITRTGTRFGNPRYMLDPPGLNIAHQYNNYNNDAFYHSLLREYVHTSDSSTEPVVISGATYVFSTQSINQNISTLSKELILPDNITEISGCSNVCEGGALISAIKLPKNLTKVTHNTGGNFCNKLYCIKEIKVPEYCTEIDVMYAFNDLYSLETIILPNGLKHLGKDSSSSKVLSRSYNLKTLHLPSSIETLGCIEETGLTYIALPANLKVFGGLTAPFITEIILPEGLQKLGTMRLNSVKELIIPSTVTSVEYIYGDNLQRLVYLCNASAIKNIYITTVKDLVVPENLACTINLSTSCSLTTESFINLCKNLADLTGQSAKTITLNKYVYDSFVNNTFVDESGDIVDITTPNAITLANYIINKNWTISWNSGTDLS